MKTHQLVIDFETYYDIDTKYSLKAMTTTEYVLDPRFEVMCLSYKINGGLTQQFTGTKEEIQAFIDREFPPAAETEVIGHHLMFDGAILEWHFGYVPAKYFCTMQASRPFVAPFTNRMSLDKCCEFYNLGVKGKEVHRMNGLHRLDLTPEQMQNYIVYCMGDTELAWALYCELCSKLPEDEQALLDLTIKKFTRPKLLLDTQVLVDRLDEVETNKAKMLLALPVGVNSKMLGSNPQFQALLAQYIGPDAVPRKISPTTRLIVPAFAKKDAAFLALKNHPDPKVRCLVEARLLFKSTQEESRLRRFIDISRLTATMPVPLLYYGAHTGRLSGMDLVNLQNLKRGGALRRALIAPPGYKVVSADLSAIEARIVAALSDCWPLLAQFSAMDAGSGFGPYEAFAMDVYGVGAPTTKEFKDQYPTERFVGKTCILGLGYGLGPAKLKDQLEVGDVDMPDTEVQDLVRLYRARYREIPQLWRRLSHMLNKMSNKRPTEWKMITAADNAITLPNGMKIHYPGLQLDDRGDATFNGFIGESATLSRIRIWGGYVLENFTQALARIILTRAELRLAAAGLFAVLQVHDELVFVVQDEYVDRVKEAVRKVLVDPVPWLKNLPIACNIGVGQNYGDAK